MLENQVSLTTQFKKLRDATFYGQEKKPLPYLLGVMNTVLHEIPVPHMFARTPYRMTSVSIRKKTDLMSS
jgi:type I restriction enzyme M protein